MILLPGQKWDNPSFTSNGSCLITAVDYAILENVEYEWTSRPQLNLNPCGVSRFKEWLRGQRMVRV
jgi:hypothetical protein